MGNRQNQDGYLLVANTLVGVRDKTPGKTSTGRRDADHSPWPFFYRNGSCFVVNIDSVYFNSTRRLGWGAAAFFVRFEALLRYDFQSCGPSSSAHLRG